MGELMSLTMKWMKSPVCKALAAFESDQGAHRAIHAAANREPAAAAAG